MRNLTNPGLAITEEAGYWSAFDTHITEELRIEGFMRDCMRKFQLIRKKSGLKIDDRIHLTWQSDSPTLIAMFDAWGDQMAAGLLALSIKRSDDAQSIEFEIEGEKMTFGIVKA